jgi:uncharacterized protein YjdB
MRAFFDTTVTATRHAAWLASVILVLAACSDETDPAGPPPAQPVAAVQVTAPAPTLAAGATMQLAATALNAAGAPLGGRTMTWSSGDELKATVSASGLVTAHRAGQVAIRATAEGRTGEVMLTIAPSSPAWVNIVPGPITLAPGAAYELRAVPMDEHMNEIPGLPVVWTSEDERVASVTPGGVVAAHAQGSTRIKATAGGKTGQVVVTVTGPWPPVAHVVVQPGEAPVWVNGTVKLTARTLAATGAELAGRVVTWTSDDPMIATVADDGTVAGVRPGITRIRAHSEGRSGWASIEVREPPTGSIHEYFLDGLEDFRTPRITIGYRPWVDANGASHPAYQVVTGGTLRLVFNQPGGTRWQQSVIVETFLVGGDPSRSVQRQDLRDGGLIYYDMYTGNAMLESSAQPGTIFRTRGHRDGERIVDQKVVTDSQTRPWVWVFKGN